MKSLIALVANLPKGSENNLDRWTLKELEYAGYFDDLQRSDKTKCLVEILNVLNKYDNLEYFELGRILYHAEQILRVVPLTPLKDPMQTGEYMAVSDDGVILQSTRKGSVFSNDGGKRWHDLDAPGNWVQRSIRYLRRHSDILNCVLEPLAKYSNIIYIKFEDDNACNC